MNSFRHILLRLIFCVNCLPLMCSAAALEADKVPLEIMDRLSDGEAQDLIVVFDDSEIMAAASEMNKKKGIMFDDDDTLRFKATRYAAIKKGALSGLPAGEVEVIRDYELLPLSFLRFHSVRALKTLLSNPLVIRAYQDKKEKSSLFNSSVL